VKAISGKDLAKLQKKGWVLQRTEGSHHIYVKAGNPVRISVPIHGNKPLKIGLQSHVVKLAGIDESEL
jgi:predicted RNA binding protein YcfA (HicA-like mRNA interferase family)